jgi:Ion channel
MESQASQTEPRASLAGGMGLRRRPQERWTGFVGRIANAFGMVFVLVVATYIVGSLVSYRGWSGVLVLALTGACATVALATAGTAVGRVRVAAAVAAAIVVLGAIGVAAGADAPSGMAAFIQALLLAVAAMKVLGAVLGEREVGFRTILGAISVYVILGLLFTFVYAGLDRFQAGAFFDQPTQTGDFLFFSITTLTTTGYGNLIPAAQPGRMLAGLEMLMGQIFLVTLIAGLVSLWRPGSSGRRSGR